MVLSMCITHNHIKGFLHLEILEIVHYVLGPVCNCPIDNILSFPCFKHCAHVDISFDILSFVQEVSPPMSSLSSFMPLHDGSLGSVTIVSIFHFLTAQPEVSCFERMLSQCIKVLLDVSFNLSCCLHGLSMLLHIFYLHLVTLHHLVCSNSRFLNHHHCLLELLLSPFGKRFFKSKLMPRPNKFV